MQQNTVPITGGIDYADVVTTEKDGVVYVAEEMSDSPSIGFPDWCYPNAIEVNTNVDGEIRLEIVNHCKYCESDSPELLAVWDEWQDALSEESGEPIDFEERLTDILATARHAVVDPNNPYRYRAYDGGDVALCEGQYLIFGSSSSTPKELLNDASYITAELNGTTWLIGSIDADDVDDITKLRVYDCADVCGGYVFNDVDRNGMSTTTAEELTNVL